MTLREALIQRLGDRFMRFRAAFERFDDAAAERELVGPRWNVRDLAAHMAFWTDEAARRLPEIAAGGEAAVYDFDKVNAEVYRRNRRMSFLMLLPRLRAAEGRLIDALRRVPDGLLLDSRARSWIDQAAIEHYDRHWPGLKAAAERLEAAQQ